jgi:hypothetical protein
MAFRIIHVRKGKSETQILAESKKTELMTKEELLKVGYKTKDEMINIIAQNSKNPSSAKGLRQSIKLDIFPNGGWGIGRIIDLPKYWMAQNWGHGGYTIRAKNAKALRFKDKDGKIIYRQVVHNHPIRPINFVERSILFLEGLLATLKISR